MILSLYETLCDKKIINEGTKVTGKVIASGLGQTPQLVRKTAAVTAVDKKGVLVADNTGKCYQMLVQNIQEIDGMDPVRLASVYNIKANGQVKKPGKKRGRKPKTLINTCA